MSVIDAAESGNPDDIKGLIHDIVAQLFDDAGVAYARISKRGEPYSIVDEAYNEVASWFVIRGIDSYHLLCSAQV